MLPSAQKSLHKAGISKNSAAFMTIGCFLAGAVGIQLLSRVLHRFIPSDVVDCHHEHDTEGEEQQRRPETTPLLDKQGKAKSIHECEEVEAQRHPPRRPGLPKRRPSRLSTFMTGAKTSCDLGGPCYGYGELCGQECMKIANRSPIRADGRRSHSWNSNPRDSLRHTQSTSACTTRRAPDHQNNTAENAASSDPSTAHDSPSHHHHVPNNAFLAIGVQTSIAIALHKLPEGFITYATNHANPALGFSVFLALCIHNITDGFVMALPLYLAISRRGQAILWSALLGGASQPLGAAIAALWLKLAGSGRLRPGDGAYGVMFAITAGVLASVALQLYSESLTLTHNRHVCTAFAFVGMAVLGLTYALTA